MDDNQQPRQPRTVSELFPSKWLAADDLDGRQFTLTISHVEFDLFPVHPRTQEKTTRAIAYFQRAKKALILNKTQCIAIAEIAGSEIFSDWPGTKVVLAPGKAPNGKMTIVILPPRDIDQPAAPAQPQDTDFDQRPPETDEEDEINQTLAAEAAMAQPAPDDIFEMSFLDGSKVPADLTAAFNDYRRSHLELRPPNRLALENWSGIYSKASGKYHV